MPVADLTIGKESQCQHTGGRGNGKPWSRNSASVRPVERKGPHDHQEQTNERDVGIAIGHCLITGLDQSDHRHRSAQKPEPANAEDRAADAPAGLPTQ